MDVFCWIDTAFCHHNFAYYIDYRILRTPHRCSFYYGTNKGITREVIPMKMTAKKGKPKDTVKTIRITPGKTEKKKA